MDETTASLIEAHLGALVRLVALHVVAGSPSTAEEIDLIMDNHDATVAAILH